jgi:type II secretory pathway pseudopilin PulG
MVSLRRALARGDRGFTPLEACSRSASIARYKETHQDEPLTGFTLLTSIILSSVVLSLGLALLDVAYKQLILASSAKQSQHAFYAADAALECALYWDGRTDFFKGNPFDYVEDDIVCDDAAVAFDLPIRQVSGATTTTSFDATFAGGATCASVVVQKGTVTLIYANGYNTCDDTDPRRVERGVKARF